MGDRLFFAVTLKVLSKIRLSTYYRQTLRGSVTQPDNPENKKIKRLDKSKQWCYIINGNEKYTV